jgi:hypothetical protein
MNEFWAQFWTPVDIPALPLLQQLNDWVIKQNEKRLPKWKFLFAADFAMQIALLTLEANEKSKPKALPKRAGMDDEIPFWVPPCAIEHSRPYATATCGTIV